MRSRMSGLALVLAVAATSLTVAATGGPSMAVLAQTMPSPPVRPAEPAPAEPVRGEMQSGGAGTPATPSETRALLDAASATAKATRELVDYTRVVPDILTQILTKLDKIEDKLDKIDTALKAPTPPRRR